MSITFKTRVVFLLIISSNVMLFSQEKKQDTVYLLLKLDKTVISSISKDSTRASFGVIKKDIQKKIL